MKSRSMQGKYSSYSRLYDRMEKSLSEKGLTPARPKMKETQWRAAYTALRNTRRQEIAEGTRKSVSSINRDLVAMQKYTFSRKQAEAQQRIWKAKHPGRKVPSLTSLRLGQAQNERIMELMDLGMSDDDIASTVYAEFYKSE